MLPLTVGFVDQMLNLSKNGIELFNTHSVVGIEPVWIFSQIFIQSVKLTKILTCLIYRVYPILSIVIFPSKKKQCSCCLSPVHNVITMVYIYRNASKCYVAEFTKSVEPLKCISIYSYLLSIGKTYSSATGYYHENGNKTNSSATSFNMKNHSAEQKLQDKKGCRAKKLCCKKLQ